MRVAKPDWALKRFQHFEAQMAAINDELNRMERWGVDDSRKMLERAQREDELNSEVNFIIDAIRAIEQEHGVEYR